MSRLMGKRVLIVGDDALVGEVIAESICKIGGLPLGPVMSEREALDLIDYDFAVPDAAILDVRLDGTTLNVANRLQKLGIPFVFATSNSQDLPAHLSDARRCEKPFTLGQLLRSLDDAVVAARH